METYNVPPKLVSDLLEEIERLDVPQGFVRRIVYRGRDGNHGDCYPVLADKEGNMITVKRGMTDDEIKRYTRLAGAELEIDEHSVASGAKCAQLLFKEGLNGFNSNSIFVYATATIYELRREAEEKLKSCFRKLRSAA